MSDMFRDTKEVREYLDSLFDPNFSIDPKTRGSILKLLKSYDKSRLDILLDYDIDNIPFIRRQMVFSIITESNNPDFINYFRALFYKTGNIKTKRLIISSLSKFEDDTVLGLLDDIVNSSDYFSVKKEIQKAYDKWYIKRPIKYYINSLREGGKNLKSLKVASDAIIKSKDPSVINDLVDMLKIDDPILIREIAKIIFHIDPISFYDHIREKFFSIFNTTKEESSIYSRINEALKEKEELLFKKMIINLLKHILKNDDTTQILNNVAISFKRGQDKKAMEALSSIRNNSALEGYAILYEAFYILARDGYEKAHSFISRSMKQYESYILIYLDAAKSLLKTMCKGAGMSNSHQEDLIKLIKELIASREEKYISIAIESGVYLRSKEFIDIVYEIYQDLSMSLRYLLAESIANFNDEASLGLLMKLAEDSNPNVSIKAIESCLKIGFGDNIIREITANDNVLRYSNLVTAIGNANKKAYNKIVIEGLETDNPNLLTASLHAIKKMEIKEALDSVLEIALKNNNKRVINSAVETIAVIGSEENIDLMFSIYAGSKDYETKASVFKAIDTILSRSSETIKEKSQIRLLKDLLMKITELKHGSFTRVLCSLIRHIHVSSTEEFKDLQKLVNDTINALQLKGMEFSEEIDIISKAKSSLIGGWDKLKRRDTIRSGLQNYIDRQVDKSRSDRESFYDFLEKTMNIYELSEDRELMELIIKIIDSILNRFLFLEKAELIKILDQSERLGIKLSLTILNDIKDNIKSRIIEEKISNILKRIYDENFELYYDPRKIAIIDSSQFIHKRLESQLKKEDYIVYHYKNLKEAFEDIEKQKNLGIIILEPMVSNKNEDDLIRSIKNIYPEEAFPRIFILSSIQDKDKIDKYISLGIRRYLIKPRDINNLINYIKEENSE